MELEKFIEVSILQYLDKKASEIADQANLLREEEFSMFEITEDYAKDINLALKEGNVNKAKQILEEVKNKYLQASEGSISKRRLYAIMEEIYEQIKDFEEGVGEKSLLDTIREYEQKGLFEKPELFKKKDAQSMGIIISNITSKEKAIEELIGKENPPGKNIERAARIYKELKELIKRIPSEHQDLKGKVSERALNQYNLIKKAKENYQKPNAQAETENEVMALEGRLATIRGMKEGIVKSHNLINDLLQKNDLVGCVKEYHNLKKLCHNFPKELSEERLALLAEALSVYEKIKALKDKIDLANAEHKESTVPPPPPPKQDENKPDTIVQIFPKEEKQVVDPIQKIKDDIAISQRVIDEFISQKDINGAMKEYGHLKILCKIFPKEPDPQEKVTLLAGALAAFEKIRKAKEALSKKMSLDTEIKRGEEELDSQYLEFKNELITKISHVNEFLAQKDSQNAIAAYAEMKQFFNTYPDDQLEKKKQLYDLILDAHLDMALLDKDFKNKSLVQTDFKIKDIRDGLEEAKALINSKRNDESAQLLLELKHKALILPSEEFDQKYVLLKEIDDLEHKIVFAKNVDQLDAIGGSLK